MTAREEVARLLAEHQGDAALSLVTSTVVYDGCRCGWYPDGWSEAGGLHDWADVQARHQVTVLTEPSRGLICPAPLAHVEVREVIGWDGAGKPIYQADR